MSQALTITTKNGDVLTKEQVCDVDASRTYHAASRKSAEDHIIYSFLCGGRLESLKASCKHGEFISLIKANIPELSNGAQDRHRQTYKAISSKFPTVGNLEPKLLPGPGADSKAKEKFMSAVHENFDGKTITAIWRDLGIVKAANPLGRKPGEGGRKRVPLAEQKAALLKQASEHWFKPIEGIADQLHVYGAKFTVLTDADIEAQVATLERALIARKTWLKTPFNQRDAKPIEKILKGK
jgi:hypothetical protein